MKLTIFLVFIAVVGLVFAALTQMSTELNDKYPSTHQINVSKFDNEYNYINDLNESVGAIQERFNVITDEDKGFFTRLGAGIVAIPYAVILFPKAVLQGSSALGSMITNFGQIVFWTTVTIYMITFIAIIWVIGMLIKFFQKEN